MAERSSPLRTQVPAELQLARKQVAGLQTLLEALAPIPGIDAMTLARTMDDPANNGDMRDKKILALAKSKRNTTLALARERDETRRLMGVVSQLENDSNLLAEELKARSEDPDAKRYPFKAQKRPPPVEEEPAAPKPTKREVQLGKQAADLRRRLEETTRAAQDMRRALAREVGDEHVATRAGTRLRDVISSCAKRTRSE